jgi:hypothetical protein
MSKAIIMLLYIVVSCSFKPDAKGVENEIFIFVSPEDKPYCEPLLGELFSTYINTPQKEYEFKLIYKSPWQLEEYKHFANLLIISLDYPADSTGDLLMQKLLLSQNIYHSIFNLENLYANQQIVTGLHSVDGIALQKEIESNGAWIFSQYQNSFNNKMTTNVYKHGINEELSASTALLLGYTLDFQPDFQEIRRDSLKQFIWTGRGYPYRWLTLHKSNRELYLNPASAWIQLETDFSIHIPEITISQYFKQNDKVKMGDKSIPLIRGMYEHGESESGGPFFVYIFDTDSSDEVILVSGFVNYPGREKLILLKQLEIIAKTIHKKGNT